jgi:hypothetical protein
MHRWQMTNDWRYPDRNCPRRNWLLSASPLVPSGARWLESAFIQAGVTLDLF